MSYPDLISAIAVQATRENVSGGNNLKEVVLIFPHMTASIHVEERRLVRMGGDVRAVMAQT